ncbi:hypothetical protein [Amycolatopsis methanolica]|uniref:hypothetical protein n=1 Tax=Amycolatopsis methanolica TaxID=1814 RepID=UPI000B304C19|nr:hypothetical protein [Amycolatopsis methanolica]
MTSEAVPDIFVVNQAMLLDGIRSAGHGNLSTLSPEVSRILAETGLIEGDSLTEAGSDLYRTAWVLRDMEKSSVTLGQALRSLTVLQILEQELRGFGAVPEDGVLDLLRQHRSIPQALTIEKARPLFHWMNSCGVLIYSRKNKTVRIIAPDADVAAAGEEASRSVMISPRTPFSNVVRLRRIIRLLAGVVTWADPHFGTRALEELATEVDSTKVTEIRIISGNATNVLTEKSFKDFKRFRDEMTLKGITSAWRVDHKRDWHDRWLVARDGAWNVPPVNNLFQNQYSEILPTGGKPPVDQWWERATARTS